MDNAPPSRNQTTNQLAACLPPLFHLVRHHLLQLNPIADLEEQKCPFDGAYQIEAPPESDFTYNPSNIFMCPRQSYLTAQCEQSTRLKIHYKCSLAKYMVKSKYPWRHLVFRSIVNTVKI